MLIPTGFWSYTTSDDTSSRGKLSQLRALLAAELQQQVGRSPKVNIFQDVVAIPPGSEWDHQIRVAIEEASFIIPIVTPGFLQSEWCCREVVLFKEREDTLGVRNLVFPLHYVDTDHVDGADAHQCHDAAVLDFLRTRQWTDFRHLRLKSIDNEDVSVLLETLARGVLKALRDAGIEQQRAEVRRRQDEAEALRLAETRRRTEEEDAPRRAEKQRQREESAQLAEEARRRNEAEAEEIAEARRQKAEDGAAALAEEHRVDEETGGSTGGKANWTFWRTTIVMALAVGIAGLAALAISRSPIKETPPGSPPAQPPAAPHPQLPPASATDLEHYQQTAAAGDRNAMFRIGALYASGQGVAQNYAKAREWYEKASAAGSAGAMSGLGALYANGQGVAQDYAKARDWYAKGAAAGSGYAMFSVGLLYANGQGVAQDYAKARVWYEKGAAAGSGYAMLNLGVLYSEGQGVAQNYVMAREWFERSAAAGSGTAMKRLAFLYANGLGVAQDRAKADEWKAKAEAANR